VLFHLLTDNRWQRPVYFFKQGIDADLYHWLRPYLSDEGLVFRLVPDSTLPVNGAAIETNLRKFCFHGYNDASVTIDDVSRIVALQYYDMFLDVARDKAKRKEWNEAGESLAHMMELLPFDRLQPDDRVVGETKDLERLIETDLPLKR